MTEEQMKEELKALLETDVTPDKTCNPGIPAKFHGFHVQDKGPMLAACTYPGCPFSISLIPFDQICQFADLYRRDPEAFIAVTGMGEQPTVTQELEDMVGKVVTIKPFYAEVIFKGLTFSDDEEVEAVCSPQLSPVTTYIVPYHNVVELEPLEERCPEEFAEVAGDTEVNTR